MASGGCHKLILQGFSDKLVQIVQWITETEKLFYRVLQDGRGTGHANGPGPSTHFPYGLEQSKSRSRERTRSGAESDSSHSALKWCAQTTPPTLRLEAEPPHRSSAGKQFPNPYLIHRIHTQFAAYCRNHLYQYSLDHLALMHYQGSLKRLAIKCLYRFRSSHPVPVQMGELLFSP